MENDDLYCSEDSEFQYGEQSRADAPTSYPGDVDPGSEELPDYFWDGSTLEKVVDWGERRAIGAAGAVATGVSGIGGILGGVLGMESDNPAQTRANQEQEEAWQREAEEQKRREEQWEQQLQDEMGERRNDEMIQRLPHPVPMDAPAEPE